ncbi:MAG TPA: glycosyltransferase family 2 protein [Pyrinomonadaceae bacterium]|jgi:glycosyltransferase involved in cell wall biosynthesis
MKEYVKKDPNLPTLMVVTPAYNQAEFLRDTIESVLSQDYPNIEHVVLDDGSTDETPRILKEYDGKIIWETHKNMGQTPTINKGWAMTKGEIITWLNSDDTFYDSTSVRTGIEYLINNPDVGIVFGDSMYTEADGTEIEPTRPVVDWTYEKFIRTCENFISQPSAFIRREIYEKVGELDPKFYYFMDWDFWMRAGIYFKIEHIEGIFSTYRLHADSKTVSQAKKAAPELEYMYKKYFARDDLPAEIRAIEKESMMNMCFTTGNYYLQGDDPESASKMADMAFKYNPAGKFNLGSLHKYLYCKFGSHPIYRKSRALYRGQSVSAS